MKLVPCSACHRHVDSAAATCPFCGAETVASECRPLRKKLLTQETAAVALGIGLALTACACYGPPPRASESRPDPATQQPAATTTQQQNPGAPGYAQPPPEERAH